MWIEHRLKDNVTIVILVPVIMKEKESGQSSQIMISRLYTGRVQKVQLKIRCHPVGQYDK